MKRAMAIAAGVITFAASASAQSGEYWIDPSAGERIKILESRPVPLTPPGDRFMLISQTATDAPSPVLAEVVRFEVRCSSNPRVLAEYWPRFRYKPGQKQIVLFTDRRRIGEVRRIDLETMTYEVVWAEYVHETGVCKEVLQLPAPAPVRPSADTATNTPRAEIKVVAPETDAQPAVITVSGQFSRGDNIRFFDAIEKIRSATIYLNSPGGDTSAGVGIGEIIHERNFRTAVINYGKCISACAIAWLGGTKRYVGDSAVLAFHHPTFPKDIVLDEATSVRSMERTLGIINSYVVSTLALSKDTAEYVTVMVATNPNSLNYLTPEDGEKYGIAFTRMNIPGYEPLP
jgi:hypothetical protein